MKKIFMYGKHCQIQNGLGNNFFSSEVIPKCKECFYNFLDELVAHPEMVYSNHERLKDFSKKKVLVIGGGGSVDRFINFDTVESEYDSIWSLNSFYLHPRLKNIKIGLCSFGPDNTPCVEPALLEYLDKYKPLVGFELHYKWSTKEGRTKIIKHMNEEFYDLKNMFYFQSKFYAMIGAGARLKILACVLGVSELSFIGFDGYQAIVDGNHAFEPGKAKLPSRCNLYGNAAGAAKQWAYEYEFFWHYIKEKFPKTHIISIDKANPYHQAV